MSRIDELIDAATAAVDEDRYERAQALAQIAQAAALASVSGSLANVVTNLERPTTADIDPLDGWTPSNIDPTEDGAYVFVNYADIEEGGVFHWRSGEWWDWATGDEQDFIPKAILGFTHYRRHPFA